MGRTRTIWCLDDGFGKPASAIQSFPFHLWSFQILSHRSPTMITATNLRGITSSTRSHLHISKSVINDHRVAFLLFLGVPGLMYSCSLLLPLQGHPSDFSNTAGLQTDIVRHGDLHWSLQSQHNPLRRSASLQPTLLLR